LRALCEPDEVRRVTSWFSLFDDERWGKVLAPEMRAELRGAPSAVDVFAEHLGRTDASDVISRMLYVDTKLWLPDDLLARGDKTSMATSLEARVPLLDYPLVEFAASLPPSLKVHGKTRKYLLRKVAGQWLPEGVLTRKKQGFPTPVGSWFRNEARDLLWDHLSPAAVARRGLFDPGYVSLLMDEHENRVADHSTLLYGLLNVELWHRLFVDSTPRALDAVSAAG
jgi:asparagine synthase (glutamine-hydrolysing)